MPADLRGLPLALALGGLGGWLFLQINFPLAWLLGAVCLTMAGAFAGLNLLVPTWLRNGMVLVLGLLVGSGFTPEILNQIQRWTVSISAVILYAIVATGVVYWIIRRLFGLKVMDALFASLPGGLANVVFIGAEMGADLRTLSLIHSVRIVLVCFTIPLWFRLVEGIVTPPGAGILLAAPIGLTDVLLFIIAGALGHWLAKKLKIPAHFLIGPMLLSAAMHLSGLTTAKPPGFLINAAQVVVGSSIGCRFVGVPFRRILAISGQGVTATVLMLAVSLGFAYGTHLLTDIPFAALVLAFAPGGLPEMTLVALALRMDVALVVTHHLARLLFVNIACPFIFQYFTKRQASRSAGDGPS